MEHIPLSALLTALIVLLILSAFFSMSETSMMAANRYRLRHKAKAGHRGARVALTLLESADKLLGVILLGNNLVNAGIATLIGAIAIGLFGDDQWALGAATLFTTFVILVCSEITPKVIAAAYADKISPIIAFLLWPLLRAVHPVVWFVNLFSRGLLALMRIKPKGMAEAPHLTADELRSVVLESGQFIPPEHRGILVNLFDLEHVTVEDIMTPRGEIEGIDITAPIEEIREKLATSFHTRLPVYEGDPGNVLGIAHLRRLLAGAISGEIDHALIRANLSEPYFIPADTPVYDQLRFFRENRQRQGLVVDEYGELLGLVTIEDIVEEIVGKFTTSLPGSSASLAWQGDCALIDGGYSLREINRALGLSLPTDGPKTLNGLIIEHLRDIPEVGVGLRIGGVPMEIVQTENRRVKIVKIHRPRQHVAAT